MALTVSLTVTPPGSMTDTELIRLISDGLGWGSSLGVTRGAFIKQALIDYAISAARDRKRQEAQAAAATQAEIDTGGISGS